MTKNPSKNLSDFPMGERPLSFREWQLQRQIVQNGWDINDVVALLLDEDVPDEMARYSGSFAEYDDWGDDWY